MNVSREDRRLRILLVAADSIVPGPSRSGTAVIRWGLIAGLKAAGAEVGFYSARSVDANAQYAPSDAVSAFDDVVFWFQQPGPRIGKESVAALARAVGDFKPDAILAYGVRPTRLVRASGYTGLLGIMSVDLEFLPRLYKTAHKIREGKGIARAGAAMLMPAHLGRAAYIWARTRRFYPLADFVVNHAANHADWHRRRHRRPTLYVPNPVAKIFDNPPPRIDARPPRFVLLGGLAGTATLSGLEWFARHVYPLLESAIAEGRLSVHLVGRNELTTLLQTMRLVERRGYVEDIGDELSRARAMLVPTPIRLGFRTRILDAFRHNVAVIAHNANASGMPELVDGRNALLASTGRDFAQAMLRLAHRPEEAARLAAAGFREFTDELNAEQTGRKIVAFIESVAAPGHRGREGAA